MTPACRPAGRHGQYFQSPEAKPRGPSLVPLEHTPWVFVLIYAVSLLFPSLMTKYFFSACAIQLDVHVIRSRSQWKSHNFSGRARDTGKLKKQGNFWLPRIRKECAPEFKTLADYVIPRNKSFQIWWISETRLLLSTSLDLRLWSLILLPQIRQSEERCWTWISIRL